MGVDESSRRTFELLANETRLGIISALGEASGEGGYATLAFSELQEATGVEDNGHFNYHLQELVGEFVEDREDGYALTLAGIRAYQAIVARVQRDSLSVEPFEIDGTCLNCGATQEAWYENSRAQVACRSCGEFGFKYPVPSESFDSSEPETLLNALDRQLSRDYLSMFNGVCPYCAGRSTVQLAEFEEYYEDLEMASTPITVHAACDSCAWFLYGNLGALLIFEPAIYTFLRERGVDLWEEYVWDPTPDHEVTNVSWEPQRVSGVFRLAGEELRYVLDEDLRLLEYEIVSGD